MQYDPGDRQYSQYAPSQYGTGQAVGRASVTPHTPPNGLLPAGGRNKKKAKKKGWFAVVAAVAGFALTVVGIITGVRVLMTDPPPPPIPTPYQKLVIATCQQVHAVLTKEHSEVIWFDPRPGVNDPLDAIRVHKDALLAVMRSNIAQVRTAFDSLNHTAPPSDLADRHKAAKQAQDAWLAHYKTVTDTVAKKVHDGDRATRLNALGVDLQAGNGQADTTLDSAMTALAGEACHCSQ